MPARSARAGGPRGLTIDQLGNLYVAEGDILRPLSRVRRVDATNGTVTTVAGTGPSGYNGDGIPATSVQLNGPRGVVFDPAGNLYIADTLNQRVRRVDAQMGIITTVVGTGIPSFGGDGGQSDAATLFYPRYINIDSGGNLYVTDQANSRIRRVALGSGGT